MADKNDLTFKVRAVDDATPTLERVKKSAKELSTLGTLKSGLGEESGLGNLGKILAGTGAVAGLTLVSRLLGDTAKKAVELKDAFNDGSKSAGEIADELVKSLPILGSIRTAGLAIRELFTGEAAEVARLRTQAEAVNAALTARIGLQRAVNEAAKPNQGIIEGQRRENIESKLPAPFAGAASSLFQSDDKRKQILENYRKEIEGINKAAEQGANGKSLKELREQLNALLKTEGDAQAKVYDAQAVAASKAETAANARGGKGSAGFANAAANAQASLKEVERQYNEAKAAREQLGAVLQQIDQIRAKALKDAEAAKSLAIDDVLKNALPKAAAPIIDFAKQAGAALMPDLRPGAIAAKTYADLVEPADISDVNAEVAEQQAHQRDIERKFLSDRIDLLTQIGELGDEAAAREAEYLRIADEINERKQDLLAIANDLEATDEQRLQAEEEIDKLGDREKLSRAAVDQKFGRGPTSVRLAGGEDTAGSGFFQSLLNKYELQLNERVNARDLVPTVAPNNNVFLTGVADSAREQNLLNATRPFSTPGYIGDGPTGGGTTGGPDDKQTTLLDDIKGFVKTSNDILQKIADSVKSGAGQSVGVFSGGRF